MKPKYKQAKSYFWGELIHHQQIYPGFIFVVNCFTIHPIMSCFYLFQKNNAGGPTQIQII